MSPKIYERKYGWRSVVFLTDDDYDAFEEAVESEDFKYWHGPEWTEAAMEYLLQWEDGEGEIYEGTPWGGNDSLFYPTASGQENYVISINFSLGYIALQEKVELP